MESFIEKSLENPEINSQEELKRFIKDLQSKITLFEKQVYEKDAIDQTILKKIRNWRTKLLQIVKENKELPEVINEDETAGMEVLKMLSKQIECADTNQKILVKSTLKLASLDLSTSDLDKVIVETRKKFESGAKREQIEYKKLLVAFIVFLGICLGILLDKIRMKY
ncbi:hypothetical protein GINT2_002263 [Glugoides intestinalis]